MGGFSVKCGAYNIRNNCVFRFIHAYDCATLIVATVLSLQGGQKHLLPTRFINVATAGHKNRAHPAWLETSRMQVNHLIDPEDTSVNLNTIAKVAEAMGKKLEFRFE